MSGASLSRWTMTCFAAALAFLVLAQVLMLGGYGFPATAAEAPETLVLVHIVTIGWLSMLMLGALFKRDAGRSFRRATGRRANQITVYPAARADAAPDATKERRCLSREQRSTLHTYRAHILVALSKPGSQGFSTLAT